MPPLRPFQVSAMLALSAVGYFYISANTVTEGDTISIGGRTYEFHNGAVPVAGNVAIDMSAHGAGAWNANDAVAHAVVAINADANRTVEAADIGGNVIGLVTRTPGATNPAIADTVDATACLWPSAFVMVGGTAEGRLAIVPGLYTMTAQDVTTLASGLGTAEIVLGAFPSTTAPRLLAVLVRRAGAFVDLADGILTLRQVATNYWVLCYAEPAAGALLAAADVVDFVLGVPGV